MMPRMTYTRPVKFMVTVEDARVCTGCESYVLESALGDDGRCLDCRSEPVVASCVACGGRGLPNGLCPACGKRDSATTIVCIDGSEP